MANKVNWEEIKAKLDALEWQNISERWESRSYSMGKSKAFTQGKETREETLDRLDLEASRFGIFLEFSDEDPEVLLASQGRLKNTPWHPSNQKGNRLPGLVAAEGLGDPDEEGGDDAEDEAEAD